MKKIVSWKCRCGFVNNNAGTVCKKCWNERPRAAAPPAAPTSSDIIVGDWREVLDSKTSRKYFFNSKTKETTWSRPLEMDPNDVEVFGTATAVPQAATPTTTDAPTPTAPTTTSAASSPFSSYACVSKRGVLHNQTSKINQDRFVMVPLFNEKFTLFGVLDGHGNEGHVVADYIKENLPPTISKFLNEHPDLPLEESVRRAFIECQEVLLRSSIPADLAGTTATICLLESKLLHVFHIGDSRAMIARRDRVSNQLVSHDITRDHKPDLPDEKKRIESAGGRVHQQKLPTGPAGPARVWLPDAELPGLAVSRAFGNRRVASVGVISEPEYNRVELDEKCEFIIIASDGLWEFVGGPRAMGIAVKHISDGAKAATNALLQEAAARWQTEEQARDDITIAIILLNHP